MRSKSLELMQRISDFVGDYFRVNHSSPKIREIAKSLKISTSTVHDYLVEMSERNMLSYDGRTIGDLPKIEKTPTGFFSAPLVGSIRCGDPENEEEEVEMYITLPEAIFGSGSFYMLRAVGDSMEDRGIEEGDLLLIQKQSTCKVGDIVVAKDEEEENTLKVFGGVDSKSKRAVLEYANEAVYPGKKIYVKELVVQGVVRNIIKWA